MLLLTGEHGEQQRPGHNGLVQGLRLQAAQGGTTVSSFLCERRNILATDPADLFINDRVLGGMA